MNEKQTIFNWQQAVYETYQSMIAILSDRLPHIVGAIVTLLIGLLIAYFLRLAARKLTFTAEALLLNSAVERGMRIPTRRSYSALIGSVTFWSVLLFFMTVSANILGWQIFSDFLGKLLIYLPQLFSGLLIVLVGFVLGGVVGSLIETTASSAGLANPELPARIAQIAVVITALIIGIEQLGINITFLTTTFIVLGAVVLSGAALAFGLGARDYVANLIGAQFTHKHFQLGQWIKLANAEGVLLEITQTALVLDTEQGRMVVPASLLQQHVSEIVTEGDGGDGGGSLLGSLFRKKEDNNGMS